MLVTFSIIGYCVLSYDKKQINKQFFYLTSLCYYKKDCNPCYDKPFRLNCIRIWLLFLFIYFKEVKRVLLSQPYFVFFPLFLYSLGYFWAFPIGMWSYSCNLLMGDRSEGESGSNKLKVQLHIENAALLSWLLLQWKMCWPLE